MQTVKAMLKKSIRMVHCWHTERHLECGYSPAQLLMCRQLRTSIPESKQLRDRQDNIKTRQTVDYDRYHRAQPSSTLSASEPVWVQDTNIGGTVVGKAGTPSSICTDPDDMSTKESTTSGAVAERDTRTDANQESDH